MLLLIIRRFEGGETREKEGVPRVVEALQSNVWAEMNFCTGSRPSSRSVGGGGDGGGGGGGIGGIDEGGGGIGVASSSSGDGGDRGEMDTVGEGSSLSGAPGHAGEEVVSFVVEDGPVHKHGCPLDPWGRGRERTGKDHSTLIFNCNFCLHTSTFQLLDEPWSQVSSLLPPASCLQFLLRIGFSSPTARRFFVECC